jgi:hypothetical protein
MQTATLYTLQSKVVPVYNDKILRYLDRVEDVTPLYIEGEHTVFTDKALFKETYLPLHHVWKSFRVSRGCSEIRPPGPWQRYDSGKDWKTGDDINTYHHLFAVEPELEGILWHVFNEEKVAGKISKLEHEKRIETDKSNRYYKDLTEAKNKNAELQRELDLTRKDYLQLGSSVDYFRRCNIFRRLWVAFRNDLTP